MSQILPVAASSDLLATWAVALAQSQETSPETSIPTQVIFNVAAYPFDRTIPIAAIERPATILAGM